MKKITPIVVIILIIVVGFLIWQLKAKKEVIVEPVDIGNAVAKQDLIRVTTPSPNDTIKDSLTITGEARGNWFFEASFPIKLINSDGQEVPLSQGYIMTSAEWMTAEFVPFSKTITFPAQKAGKGKLVLMKDNPSGESKFDDQLIIPITFGE